MTTSGVSWWRNWLDYLYLQGLCLLRWYAQPKGQVSGKKFHRKVAVVGDEWALGYGDKARLGAMSGVTYHLNNSIFKDRKIKQFWSVYNLGVHGTTTRDWLPREETTSLPHHPHLLETWLVENELVSGCQTIGLFLGYNDHKASPPISKETTIDNIKIITRHLTKLGYQVHLFTIPPPTPPVANGKAAPLPDLDNDSDHSVRSNLIRDLINSGEIEGLQLAVEMDATNYEYRRRNLYSPDTPYFNDLGYNKLTRDWYLTLSTTLIKQEFATFCNELGYQS